eukprot:Nk52_evm42s2152 gene=Nk52_evmTU42s2152
MNEASGDLSSTNVTPQSGSKRRPSKLKWIPRRDSLAKRDSPGKKGSRRYRRFEHLQALISSVEGHREERDTSILPMYPPYCGPDGGHEVFGFYCLFKDDKKRQIWEDFVAHEEHEQEMMLMNGRRGPLHPSKAKRAQKKAKDNKKSCFSSSATVANVSTEKNLCQSFADAHDSEVDTDADDGDDKSDGSSFEELNMNDYQDGEEEVIVFTEQNINEDEDVDCLVKPKAGPNDSESDNSSSDDSDCSYDIVDVSDISDTIQRCSLTQVGDSATEKNRKDENQKMQKKTSRASSRVRKVSENETMEDAPAEVPSTERFQSINRRIRQMLRKNKSRLPHGKIEYMEQQIVEYFTGGKSVGMEEADLVWFLPSSFDRMLTHGLCQYYGLHSESMDVNGKRQTHVSSKSGQTFVYPSETLANFVKRM